MLFRSNRTWTLGNDQSTKPRMMQWLTEYMRFDSFDVCRNFEGNVRNEEHRKGDVVLVGSKVQVFGQGEELRVSNVHPVEARYTQRRIAMCGNATYRSMKAIR